MRNALGTAAALASLGGCPVVAQKTLVRLGYFSESMPFAVACARHWLDTDDYEVGCYPQSSGGYAVSRLDQGDLDVSLLGSTPAAISNSRGVRATTFQMASGHGSSQGLAVRETHGPLEMMGECLATPFGSTAHYHMLFLLDMLQLRICPHTACPSERDFSCVTLVNMSPSGLVAAWDAETIDGGYIWGEGFLHLKATGGTVIADSDDMASWGRETFIVVAARENFSTDYPGLLEHIARVKTLLDDGWLAADAAWDPSLGGNTTFLASLSHFLSSSRPRERQLTMEHRSHLHQDLATKVFYSTQTQLSCHYFAHPDSCVLSETRPASGLADAIKATAEFFMDQKGLAAVVPQGKHHAPFANELTFFDEMIDSSVLFTASGMHSVTLETIAGTGTDAVPRSTGSIETGRCDAGDTFFSFQSTSNAVTGSFTDKPTTPVGVVGASYENDMHCIFRIPAATENANLVEVTFTSFRVWSGDFVRIYEGDAFNDGGEPTGTLLAQLQGIDAQIPPIRSVGPILIEFVTDSNTEECYNLPEGDGWELSFDRSHPGCTETGATSCSNHGRCIEKMLLGHPRSVCECDPGWTGADCSLAGCMGTTILTTSTGTFRSASGSLESTHRYENAASCLFEVHTAENAVFFDIEVDLEDTFDWLDVRAGTGTDAEVLARLTGHTIQTVVAPTVNGVASLYYTTDDKGRRSGFNVDYTTGSFVCAAQCSATSGECAISTGGQERCICSPGWSGVDCSVPVCSLGPVRYPGSTMGVIQSNPDTVSIPAMTDCRFETVALSANTHVGTRLLINSFDLELASLGDHVAIAYDTTVIELRNEACSSSAACSSQLWQTGECIDGMCAVRSHIDVRTTTPLDVHVQTDRNDPTAAGGHRGVSMIWHAIAVCPVQGAADECLGEPGSCDCELSGGSANILPGACVCPDGHCDCGIGGVILEPSYLPEHVQTATNVSIALMFPNVGRDPPSPDLAAAQFAVEHINTATGLLPNHNLKIVLVDTSLLRALRDTPHQPTEVDHIRQRVEDHAVVAAVGCGYSSDVIAVTPALANTLLVSHSATVAALSNTAEYPLFGRMAMSDNQQAKALADIVSRGRAQFNWQRVGIIQCNDAYCNGLAQDTLELLALHDIPSTELSTINGGGESIANAVNSVRSWLADCGDVPANSGAVVLLLAHSGNSKLILDSAGKLGLPTSWICPDSVGASRDLTPDEAQTEAIALSPGSGGVNSVFRALLATNLPDTVEKHYALRAFDAVYTIAYAMQALLDEQAATNGAPGVIENAQALAQAMRTVTFEGASGQVRLDDSLDRVGSYDIIHFSRVNNTTQWDVVGQWNAGDRTMSQLPDFDMPEACIVCPENMVPDANQLQCICPVGTLAKEMREVLAEGDEEDDDDVIAHDEGRGISCHVNASYCPDNRVYKCGSSEEQDPPNCVKCPKDQVPSSLSSCSTCKELGLEQGVPNADQSECQCPEGTFARAGTADGQDDDDKGLHVMTNSFCEDCSGLEKQTSRLYKPEAGFDWVSPKVCPGGAATVSTICPVKKLWIHIPGDSGLATGDVKLLDCPGCIQASCSKGERPDTAEIGEPGWTFTDVPQGNYSFVSKCENHTGGFLCAVCDDGYKKVDGKCLECKTIDWGWIIFEFLASVGIGGVLLWKSMRTVCGPEDAKVVFTALDVTKDGYMPEDSVRDLLIKMGAPLAALNYHKVVADMKGNTDKQKELEGSSISLREFTRWTESHQSRNVVGTCAFFLQTMSLICSGLMDITFLEIFNLDIGRAAKTCRLPSCGLFCSMSGMAVVPIGSIVTVIAGTWFFATQYKTTQITAKDEQGNAINELDADGKAVVGKYKKTQIPGQPMQSHHLHRGLLHVFIFSYAPITRRCISLFVCRRIDFTQNEEDSVMLWVEDLAVECFERHHLWATVIACYLLACVFSVSCFMVYKVYWSHGIQTRLKQAEKLHGTLENVRADYQNNSLSERWENQSCGKKILFVLCLVLILPFFVPLALVVLGSIVLATFFIIGFFFIGIGKAIIARARNKCGRPDLIPSTTEGDDADSCRDFVARFLGREWLDRTGDLVDVDGKKVNTDMIPALNPQCWDELVKAVRPQRYWWYDLCPAATLVVLKLLMLFEA